MSGAGAAHVPEPTITPPPTSWHRLEEPPDEGRVRTAVVDGRSVALTRCGGRVGALDNHCPHQGGPLGEGSIENGWLRCPWHGYDYDPLSGKPPEGFSDAPVCYAVEDRADGVYVELPDVVQRPRSVSDVLVETLVAWGVDTVFGMVGHSNLGFAEALRRAEERGEMRYIGIRHEGAAAFAASAYGKLTGRPAACFAIAGPGSTNLLTGLYDAKLDGAPVLAISGQVPSKVLGRGAFQDVDLSAVFRDVALSTVTVHAGSDHAELAATAVKHAVDGRGVAHLVLPDEVQDVPSDAPAATPVGRRADLAVAPSPASLDAAARLLRAARRPVIIVGQGARGATAELRTLAERLGAPVLTTFRAKGLVPDTHPLGAGVLGRSGTPVASWLMNESDLLLVVGASFSNHTGIAPYKSIVQVDDAPSAIGRFHPVDVGVLGDAAVTLRALTDTLGEPTAVPTAASAGGSTSAVSTAASAGGSTSAVSTAASAGGSTSAVSTAASAGGSTSAVDQRGDVAARWAIWRAEKARRARDDRGRGVASAAVFAALTAHCPADAVIAVDVGNHAYSFGRYFESAGQPVLMSGYLGSIGFGYPAAMGAWAATRSVRGASVDTAPTRPIVAVTGDGGFGQYLAELTTAVKYGIPVKHVLLDNGVLGKISKEQLAGRLPVWQTSLVNPDFAEYTRLCGATGIPVHRADELDDAMAQLFAVDGPALLHVHADAELV